MPHKGEYKKGKAKRLLGAAMKEVHEDMPSTCPKGGCPEKQLKAIAYSKAREKGAKLPHKPKDKKVFGKPSKY